jgi:hypothetical protein
VAPLHPPVARRHRAAPAAKITATDSRHLIDQALDRARDRPIDDEDDEPGSDDDTGEQRDQEAPQLAADVLL